MALRTDPAVPSGVSSVAYDDVHAELGAVAEVVADGVGHERDGHDDLVDAVAPQQVDDVLHHRPVDQRAASAWARWRSAAAAGCPRRRP